MYEDDTTNEVDQSDLPDTAPIHLYGVANGDGKHITAYREMAQATGHAQEINGQVVRFGAVERIADFRPKPPRVYGWAVAFVEGGDRAVMSLWHTERAALNDAAWWSDHNPSGGPLAVVPLVAQDKQDERN